MAYVITQPCVGVKDRACLPVCPTDCIHPLPDEDRGEPMLFINPAECIDCNACLEVCPVQAIFPDTELTKDQGIFQEVNGDYFALAFDQFVQKWTKVTRPAS